MVFEYPAIFKEDEEDKGWINVKFPDIVCGVTCGTDMDNAIYMAKDLLKLMLTTAPKQCLGPTPIDELRKEYPDDIIIMIEVEIDEIVSC